MPETPECRRALWRAVIDQAVKDATTRSNAVADQVAKRQARAWLTHRSDDLNEVCALADLEPDAVRASAAAAIAAADIRHAAGKRRAPKADLAPQKPERMLKRIEHNEGPRSKAWSARSRRREPLSFEASNTLFARVAISSSSKKWSHDY